MVELISQLENYFWTLNIGSTEIRKTDEMSTNIAQLPSWRQLPGTRARGIYQKQCSCLIVGLRQNRRTEILKYLQIVDLCTGEEEC